DPHVSGARPDNRQLFRTPFAPTRRSRFFLLGFGGFSGAATRFFLPCRFLVFRGLVFGGFFVRFRLFFGSGFFRLFFGRFPFRLARVFFRLFFGSRFFRLFGFRLRRVRFLGFRLGGVFFLFFVFLVCHQSVRLSRAHRASGRCGSARTRR